MKPFQAGAFLTHAVPQSVVSNAVDWNALPQSLVERLAGVFGAPVESLRGMLTDKDRIVRELECASPASLVVLEGLLGAGGQIGYEALKSLIELRFRWEGDTFVNAVNEAYAGGLVLRVPFPPAYLAGAAGGVFVLREVAEILAPRLMGISLPDVPTAMPDVVAESTSTLRDQLALAATAVHFGVKSAQHGMQVNRTSIRKMAIATGLSEHALYVVLGEALANDSLDGARGLIVPSVPTLRELAARQRCWSGTQAEELITRWLHERGWVSEKALLRALVIARRRATPWPIWMAPLEYAEVGLPEIQPAHRALEACGLHKHERDGEMFVHRRMYEEKRGGDGHITPSLEVFLGPDAELDLTVTIALSAEPMRFDRVLTFKLTQASISTAINLGLDASTILDALARVGHHAVPSNVIAMVEDWSKNALSVRIRSAWVMDFSSPDAADIAARTFGSNVIARPSPSVVLVDSRVTRPESALAKLGIRLQDENSGARREFTPAEPSVALGITPDRSLREKIREAKRNGLSSVSG